MLQFIIVQKVEQRLLQNNMEILPLKIYINEKNIIKVELGIGKQKTVIDKRDDIKKKEGNRDIRRAMKNF